MALIDLVALEGIRSTMADFVFYVDNGRARDLGELFGGTGEFVLPDGSAHRGSEAITAMLEGHAAYFNANPEKAPPGYLRHHMTTVQINLTGARTATAQSYFITLTQGGIDHWGQWRDQFERADDGRWLFVRRIVVADGYDCAGWFATILSDT